MFFDLSQQKGRYAYDDDDDDDDDANKNVYNVYPLQ